MLVDLPAREQLLELLKDYSYCDAVVADAPKRAALLALEAAAELANVTALERSGYRQSERIEGAIRSLLAEVRDAAK